jgi:biotin transport system substrate-specific component
MISATSPTLAATLWPSTVNSLVLNVGIAFAGSLLLWISAKVQVPFWPVPMTMQTFVVLALAAALGARLGTATVLLYLAQGAVGLPVFAGTPEKGLGLAYMAGPTGGYLIRFVIAAFVVGKLAERGFDRTIPRMFAAVALGHAIIFAFGWGWLATLVGADKAWAVGVAPFYAATLAKTALAALTLPAAWALVRRS